MSIKKTIGGDSIGSGQRMQVEMHGYERANHDLSMINRTSIAPGTLVPIYVNVAQTGDDWEFNVNAAIRTLPTQMALFGSFQLQIHFFVCPIRLYNAALHNNGIDLGNNMEQVVYPSVRIPVVSPFMTAEQTPNAWDWIKTNMNPSALMSYIGVQAPGHCKFSGIPQNVTYRYFNSAPLLAYWDIFKNYYSNKQEEYAYYIGAEKTNQGSVISPEPLTPQVATYQTPLNTSSQWPGETGWEYVRENNKTQNIYIWEDKSKDDSPENSMLFSNKDISAVQYFINNNGNLTSEREEYIKSVYATMKVYIRRLDGLDGNSEPIEINYFGRELNLPYLLITTGPMNSVEALKNAVSDAIDSNTPSRIALYFKTQEVNGTTYGFVRIARIEFKTGYSQQNGVTSGINGMQLIKFPLKNLDKARGYVLKNFFEGEQVEITNDTTKTGYGYINYEPYISVCKVAERVNNLQVEEIPHNQFSQNGIAIRRYLNDMFNCWLDSETVERIENNTAAAVQNGQMSIATLILAEKMYKQKNRIEMAGGTYEDWKEAVYGIKQDHMSEMPMFIGGYSAEIVFDEVVSSSETTNKDGSINPLGTMGGRGTLNGRNGGRFDMKFTEDCYIIGIASVIPRVDYSQGNKWFMSLQNNDQLHKPELDAIGFQNLIGDWMCGVDTEVPLTTDANYTANKWGITKAYAKQPAWINYMTAVNECHGDFADEEKAMFMTLNRRYEIETGTDGNVQGIKDFTAYIDPRRYNYAFADATLEAQNFWLQVGVQVEPRRKLSAKIMPNL